MRRWVCPNCGRGKRAPERMQKLDVRRWCLPCSEKTGSLVRRFAPAVEKLRAERKERAAARRAEMTKKRRAAKFERETFGGVHVPTLVEALCKHFVKLGYKRLRRRPKVEMRRSRQRGHAVGHAYYARHRVTVTMHPDIERAKVYELIAHELSHLAVGLDRNDPRGRNHHGDRFNRALCDVAHAVWGVTVYIDEGGGGYGPSRALVRALRDKLDADSAHERSQDEGESSHG